MSKLKNTLASFLFPALFSGCYIREEYVIEDDLRDSQMSISLYVPGRPLVVIFPCRRAGVRFEIDEYSIRCNAETFFSHSLNTDYLQYGNVSYWDYGHDGNVDRVSFNDSSVEVNNYSVNQFYQEKLYQFRKDYVQGLWEEWLMRQNGNNP